MEKSFHIREIKGTIKPRKGRKYSLTIATWNIRGKSNEKKKSKWKDIKRIMKTQRIAVLAIQESRVTDEEAQKIEKKTRNIVTKQWRVYK